MDYKYNVAICAIFQDEAPYIKEWIEYHKLIGVEHFYLYNHRSTDGYQEVLAPYIDSGMVELKDEMAVAENIKAFNPLQCNCYNDCLQATQGICKWVAFIDIDEFILPIKPQLLSKFLEPYEGYGGLGVNWLMFGTSNIKKIPENQLLIESMTCCTEKNYVDNLYVKSIVRPERTSHFENVHQPVFRPGSTGVNSNKLSFNGDKSDYALTDKIRINHYWTRDEDYFYQKKVARQKRWGGTPTPDLIFQKMNISSDDLIFRYVPELKLRMGSNR